MTRPFVFGLQSDLPRLCGPLRNIYARPYSHSSHPATQKTIPPSTKQLKSILSPFVRFTSRQKATCKANNTPRTLRKQRSVIRVPLPTTSTAAVLGLLLLSDIARRFTPVQTVGTRGATLPQAPHTITIARPHHRSFSVPGPPASLADRTLRTTRYCRHQITSPPTRGPQG